MADIRHSASLDGPWRLALDSDDRGLEERWFEPDNAPEGQEVAVPGVWDRWVPDYDGVGWYFRAFDVDAAWLAGRLELRFEAADYYAEVWLNGVRLGEHEGGYTPFALDATAAAQPGVNRLAVRIVDPHGPEGYGPFRPKEIPCAKEEGYFSFAGLWGSVSLAVLPALWIRDVFVEPDIRRKRITVTVDASERRPFRLSIAGTRHEAVFEETPARLDFPDFEPWSPDAPHLYTLRCALLDGEAETDCVEVRFGMREFTVKDNRFFINGRPIFIKAVLHQPDYPRSLAAPESAELARSELEAAKEAGFNMVRLHIKPAPPVTLDLADELGLLLYEEPAIGWIKASPEMQTRCEREVREMILRDRNHPSVVIWGMLNETGNAGYVTGGGAQTIKDALCALARRLDPSRLIIDDSGGVNATREPARIMRPYRDVLEPYDDLHVYQRAPVDSRIVQYYANNGTPDRLQFLSEFGFGGMEDLEDAVAQYGEDAQTLKDARFLEAVLEAAQPGFAERGLDRLFGSFGGFAKAAQELQCDAAQLQIEAIRSNPKCAGYCYTQLCDAGHEFCAGVLDRWRRPKPVFETLKAVQQPLRPLIRLGRTSLVPRQEVSVSVWLANDARFEGRADLSLQVVGPTNQVLWKKKRSIKITRRGGEIWTGRIGASGSPGSHKFVVRLMEGMKVLGTSSAALDVLAPAEPCDVPVSVLDPGRAWTKRLTALARKGSIGAPIHVVPPLANTIRAYPDNELAQLLAQVKDGAVGVILEPPADWNDLADKLGPAVCATSKDAAGAFLGVYHYAKRHPVFEGLPARGLMRQTYANVVPPRAFLEPSDEDICGCFDAAPAAQGHYMSGQADWWASDILVRRYGAGRLVFTHLRLAEWLGEDPVADCLWVNLLKHFSRRSVPSDEPQPPSRAAVEWLRNEHNHRVHRWMTIGEFPNWDGAGHDTVYPPEKTLDFEATYPGWYRAIAWRPWYSRADQDHVVDLQAACEPVYEYYPKFDYGTAYAYAEFTAEKRRPVTVRIGVQDAMKVWFNGQLVFETQRQVPHDQFEHETLAAAAKQGRNTLLVKVSKIPGPFKFALDVLDDAGDSQALKWWR